MSTLVDYVRLTRSGGSGLPEYLKRTCPFGLRHGRRLKTKMRLGAHQLQGSLARMIPRHVRRPTDFHCKCCSMGVDETAKHALFECRCHVDIRRDFVARVEAVCPTFRSMSTDVRFRLVMSYSASIGAVLLEGDKVARAGWDSRLGYPSVDPPHWTRVVPEGLPQDSSHATKAVQKSVIKLI